MEPEPALRPLLSYTACLFPLDVEALVLKKQETRAALSSHATTNASVGCAERRSLVTSHSSKENMPTNAPRINIGINDADRAAIVGGLSKLLANTYALSDDAQLSLERHRAHV